MAGYAHLHVHTEYSLFDGSIKVEQLLEKVKGFGHRAVAVTDHGNMHAAIDFYKQARAAGIKPIIGCEVFVRGQPGSAKLTKEMPRPFHLVLLAANNTGYHNLIKISSGGYLQAKDKEAVREAVPVVPEQLLDEHSEGLIALSGCQLGELGFLVQQLQARGGKQLELDDLPASCTPVYQLLQQHIAVMQHRFGADGYFVEMIDNGLPQQCQLLDAQAQVAQHFALPLVCTADAHYIDRDFRATHDIFLAIKNELTLSDIEGGNSSAHFHLLDNQEMDKYYARFPEAIDNTVKIAERCNIELKFGQYHLPTLAGDPAQELARCSRQGLQQRVAKQAALTAAQRQQYEQRLEYELGIITEMKFPGYFLIVHDFVRWAKEQHIPVGPGRGSGAGSLVAYALRITDVDPVVHGLFFERFLNPERVSMPDFDIDFCQWRRDEVIKYVIARYTADNVAQITTFGKMNAKAAIRDVGRVLEISYKKVDRLARLVPNELGITLDAARQKDPRLQEAIDSDSDYRELMEFAQKLEGLNRHASVHAAGIMISDAPITDYVPVYLSEDKHLITQYEMKSAEQTGLVKFDFLGLKTLTIIAQALNFIRQQCDENFDLDTIPLDDAKVYREISQGHTTGIFQLESHGMIRLLQKLKPSNFEDIVATIALFRPGPLGSGMVDDFIDRKHGKKDIEHLLPQLEPVLRDTYGVIVYQEQVQQIAAMLANYSLGEADLLRRAMGKKKPQEMARQRSRFVEGCVQNAIGKQKAVELFELMASFAEYGFNKSHSTAYGLISYQTAYLKVNYPAQFMAAAMTCDCDYDKKTFRYVNECQRLGITLVPPAINDSEGQFLPRPTKPAALVFGLSAIKGMSGNTIKVVQQARAASGKFKSMTEFIKRVDLTKVGKKNFELLAISGCFDVFNIDRAYLHKNSARLVKYSEELHGEAKQRQTTLFDRAAHDLSSWQRKFDRDGVPVASLAALVAEKRLLGVYLSKHPLSFYRGDRNFFRTTQLASLTTAQAEVSVVAILNEISEKMGKKQQRVLWLTLEDETKTLEVALFDRDIDVPPLHTVVLVRLRVATTYNDRLNLSIAAIEPLSEVRRKRIKAVYLQLRGERLAQEHPLVLQRLEKICADNSGNTQLYLVLCYAKIKLTLASALQIDMNDEALFQLQSLPDLECAIGYPRD